MKLLNKENIELFKNLQEINDGFRIPDEAYVHGTEFECFEQLGSDAFFSNFWYGKKESAAAFAESLAGYFKEKYAQSMFADEDETYDFFGMVVLWNVGDNALVANINLDHSLAFWEYETLIPKELENDLKNSQLTQLLFDGDDNSVHSVITADCSDDVKRELLACISKQYKDEYIELAQEEGIDIES